MVVRVRLPVYLSTRRPQLDYDTDLGYYSVDSIELLN